MQSLEKKMSKEEQWITDIKGSIDQYVDLDISAIELLAEECEVEVSYVLERYRDKVTRKINKKLKGD